MERDHDAGGAGPRCVVPSVTRALGRTGLRVSRMGLGMAALGRPGYINVGHAEDLGADRRPEAMERNAHAVLDAAYDAGVRYFDAARSYGLAEAFLASWLDRRCAGRDDCVVASKWGYAYTAGWRVDAAVHEVKEHSLDRFSRQIEETRAILGARLAVYQVHSVTDRCRMFGDAQLLHALALLRDHGVAVGLTVTGPSQPRAIERALEVEVDGAPLFATVQATWNLLERSAEGALARAHDAGVGVIVKEALANGRLTRRYRHPAFAPSLAVLGAQADRLGTTVEALAFAEALAQPWADVVLSGAATVAQVRASVAASDVRPDEEASAALAALRQDSAGYWAERSRLPWN